MSFRAVRVRMRGLEPPRPEGHTDLNRARLPIPPHPRAWDSVAACRRRSEPRLRPNEDDEPRTRERGPRFPRPGGGAPGPLDREDPVGRREAPVAALVPEGGELRELGRAEQLEARVVR